MRIRRAGLGARSALALVMVLVAGLIAACDTSPPVLRGQVTDSGDGSHPSGVAVRVYSTEHEVVIAETITDGEGRYVFRESGLAEGTYRVRFSDAAWWDDATSWAAATDIDVEYGSVADINPTIVPSVGSLSGTASDVDGPVADAAIQLISTFNGAVIVSTTTAGDGTFAINDVPTGRYRVKVTAPGLAPTFYPSAATVAAATQLTVLADASVENIDVLLPASAVLTGTVTAGGSPRSDVTVVATTLAPYEVHGAAVTGPDGRFEINGLSPTSYLLVLSDGSGDLGNAVVGAAPDDPDSGVTYPLSAGASLDVGEIDLAAGGTTSPVIVTTALPDAFVGMPVQAPLEAVGGAGGHVWEVTGLPVGVELDPAAGVVTGVPMAAGVSEVTLEVTDARGQSSSTSLTLEVRPGMPDGCIVDDCALVDLAPQTVELTTDAVASVTRDPTGTLVALTLTPVAPPVALGQVLIVPPGDHTPEGVIVKATDVENLDGQGQLITVVRADLTDAYESALIKSTDATLTVDEPEVQIAPAATMDQGPNSPTSSGMTVSAAATSCGSTAQVQVSPQIGLSVNPYVSVLFGRNLFGFGNVFVGTGGLKTFQVQLDTTMTVGLSGNISGSVKCDVAVPAARAVVPLGSAGVLTFRLTPGLSLNTSAAISLNTNMTLRCSMMYRWSEGQVSQYQWCRPSATPPQATSSGADLTVGGNITATATFNELVGISGQVGARLHASYRPFQRPRGQLDGRVTANISACGACFIGAEAPSFTLAQGTLYERVFATWGYESVQPPDDPPDDPPVSVTTTTRP